LPTIDDLRGANTANAHRRRRIAITETGELRKRSTKLQARAAHHKRGALPPPIKKLSPKGGVYLAGDPSTGYTRATGIPLSGLDKEVFNRIVYLHEIAELRSSAKHMFLGHFGCGPPLQDLNIIATLSDRHYPVHAALMLLRTPEKRVIETLFPGLDLGNTRLSRHAIRRITERMDQVLDELQLNSEG
jgi:hypothetical protein